MTKSVLSDARFHHEESASLTSRRSFGRTVRARSDRMLAMKQRSVSYRGRRLALASTNATAAVSRSRYASARFSKTVTLHCGSGFKRYTFFAAAKKVFPPISYNAFGMKTVWHLTHRIRHGMAPADIEQLGGAGKVVEADETYLTNSRKTKRPPGRKKHAIMSFVKRGGNIRSVMMDHRSAMAHVRTHVHKDSRLITNQARHYRFPPVAQRDAVDHSKFEWVCGNTRKGFFSVLKRGLVGTYQHVAKHHLNRYLAEVDSRQNNRVAMGIDDVGRARVAIRGMAGKRLTYRDSCVL